MIQNPVPTLSDKGWVRDTAHAADFLMSHFFECDPRQTTLFRGSVVSVQSILATASNDPYRFAGDVEVHLSQLLSKYFDAATVTCTVAETAPGSRMTCRLDCTITSDGVRSSLGKLISVVGDNFIKVINSNNYGNPRRV